MGNDLSIVEAIGLTGHFASTPASCWASTSQPCQLGTKKLHIEEVRRWYRQIDVALAKVLPKIYFEYGHVESIGAFKLTCIITDINYLRTNDRYRNETRHKSST